MQNVGIPSVLGSERSWFTTTVKNRLNPQAQWNQPTFTCSPTVTGTVICSPPTATGPVPAVLGGHIRRGLAYPNLPGKGSPRAETWVPPVRLDLSLTLTWLTSVSLGFPPAASPLPLGTIFSFSFWTLFILTTGRLGFLLAFGQTQLLKSLSREPGTRGPCHALVTVV